MDEPKTKYTAARIANDSGSRYHIHTLALMAMTVVGIYLCYRLAVPFFPALAWALALAVLFAPLHRWLESKVKRSDLAATLSVLIVSVIVVVPAIFVLERIIGEAVGGAETIKTMVESGEWRRTFGSHPVFAPVGLWIEQQFDLPGIINNAISWLTNTAASLVRGSVLQLIGVILTFYLLFYFLRDQEIALKSLSSLSPLPETDMTHLFNGVADTIHATLYGTLAVAVAVVQNTSGNLDQAERNRGRGPCCNACVSRVRSPH